MNSVQELLGKNAQDKRRLPVYVLSGEEHYLKERAIAALRCGDKAEQAERGAVESFDATQQSATAVLQAACTLSMFSPQQTIIVNHFDEFPAAEQQKFIEYLENPSPGTTLILNAEKLDGRGKLSKVARSKGYLFEAGPLRPPEVRGFIRSLAERRGHAITPEAISQLIDAIGNNLYGLDDALERLSLYVGADKTIDATHVSACIEATRSETIWMLVDGVAGKDAKSALQALRSLLADREPALKILAMIARQLRIVARARASIVRGSSALDAAKDAGAPPFKADELARAARQYSDATLARALLRISNCDQQLKGSFNRPESVIEEAVMALCA